MFSRKKVKRIFLLSAVLALALGAQSSNVFASTESSNVSQRSAAELEKIFSGKSSDEEVRNFVKEELNSEDENAQTTTVNEFEMCKTIDERNGVLPSQDGSKVKEYLKRVKELSKKDRSELESMGISDERINAIQKSKNISLDESEFDSSTIMYAIAAAADSRPHANVSGYFYDHTYQGSQYKTVIYITSGWNWTSPPLFNGTDGFATSWSSATNLQLASTNSGAEYYRPQTGEYLYNEDHTDEAWNNRPDSLNGTSFEFRVGKGSALIVEYAKSGYSLNALVSTDFYVGSLTNSVAYAHAYTVLTPDFSINATGGIDAGLAFEKVSEVKKQAYYFKKTY